MSLDVAMWMIPVTGGMGIPAPHCRKFVRRSGKGVETSTQTKHADQKWKE